MRHAVYLLALPLAACGSFAFSSEASGDPVAAQGAGSSRTFAASDFTKVDLRGADDVEVTVGKAFAVRAEGTSDALDQLDIRRDGDTLRVGRKEGTRSLWDKSGKVRITVTMPRMVGASVAGSGDMRVDSVAGDRFDAAVAGSGDLTLGALKAARAEFAIAGSGTIAASGQVEAMKASIAGSGDVAAPGLKAARAEISIAGSGDVEARVEGPAEVSLLGSGSVRLGSAAKCKVSKMGSGSADCG